MVKKIAAIDNTSPSNSGTKGRGVAGKPDDPCVVRRQKKVFSRAKLVGKFPNIRHQPAPAAHHRLTDEDRRQWLAAMALV